MLFYYVSLISFFFLLTCYGELSFFIVRICDAAAYSHAEPLCRILLGALLLCSLCSVVSEQKNPVLCCFMRNKLMSFLVVQWLSVGLVIERSLLRLPAGALSSQLGQLSLLSLRGR